MSALISDDALHDLVSMFYECVLEPARWDAAVEKLATAFDVPAVHLLFWNKVENRLQFDTVGAGPSGEREEVLAAAADYSSHWGQCDYRLSHSTQLPAGTWFQCHEVFRERNIRDEPFFNEYIKQWDFRWLAGFHVLSRDHLTAHLGLHRRLSQQPLNRHEMTALAWLGRHLSNSARMFVDAEDLRHIASLGLDALHAWAVPSLLLESTGRVRFANRAAERLLRDDASLAFCAAKIRLNDVALQRSFSRALDQAIHSGKGQAMAIPRSSGTSLIASFYPLPRDGHRCLLASAKVVLLTLADPADLPASHQQILRQVFGLTMREAELALALCEGVSPTEFSQRLGVSIHTVRSQIRSIYTKCGISRQCDLARTIAAIPRHGPTSNLLE